MEKLMDRIVVDPEILVGKPVIKGTRIPVYLIIEFLANGLTQEEILDQYPTLKREDIKAALLYASKCLDREVTVTM
ncbi:MAG: DUF433 domain-containing protein [Candidatus Bathyarchaeia archaeon]|jgi:uncharacterized protein (DUF433 family)